VDYSFLLNTFDAAVILGVSFPAISCLQDSRAPCAISPCCLLVLLVHGLYHLAEALATFDALTSLGYLSDAVIEPAGGRCLRLHGVLQQERRVAGDRALDSAFWPRRRLQALAPFMEVLSLALIIASFAIISISRSGEDRPELQFEMFLFMLVLAAAEAPRSSRPSA